MRLTFTLSAFALLSALPLSARADVVTDWNKNTVDEIRKLGLGPNPATRTLAIAHIAAYEAVNAVTKSHEPYHAALTPILPVSQPAAVGGAGQSSSAGGSSAGDSGVAGDSAGPSEEGGAGGEAGTSGHTGGKGGASSGGTGGKPTPPPPLEDDGDLGCSIASPGGASGAFALTVLLGAASLVWRRRRDRR